MCSHTIKSRHPDGYHYWGQRRFLAMLTCQLGTATYADALQLFMKFEHFGSVVWRSTRKFGFAISKRKLSQQDCKNLNLYYNWASGVEQAGCTCWWAVGHYSPPGHIAGKYKWNVRKGKFNRATHCKNDRFVQKVRELNMKKSV